MKKDTQATYLRNSLLTLLGIIVISMAGGFYYAQDQLRSLSKSSVGNDSTVNMTSEQLIQLQTAVISHKAAANKAASLIASAQDYQNQIMNDLDKYANDTGMHITSYSSTSKVTTDVISVSGLQPSFMTISLSNPVQYQNLIRFLELIETNIPKMQMTGISINRVKNSSLVSVDSIIIEVFVK